jgi:hypothetical protein
MPIDFPDSPTLGQIYTAPTGRAWEWDGIRWISATENNINDLVASQVASGLETIIGSAPAALDTLQELAQALNNDEDFASTVTGLIDGKASTGKAIAMSIVFG